MRLSQRIDGKVQQRQVEWQPDAEAYDVIVVGMGTSGAIAAISAAEQGLRVLGIERMTAMGGTGTVGAVIGYYFGNKGGLFEAIDQEVLQRQAQPDYTKAAGVSAELKKLALEKRVLAAGVVCQYDTTVIGVYMEGKEVKGVRFVGPDGVGSAFSQVVIDCSGEAEVCAMAGAAYRKGRETDGKMQPFSNAIVWIDKDTVKTFYTDSGYVDPEDSEGFTRAVIDSACLWTHQPESFTDSPKFVKLAPQLGIREGRFIVGEQNVTFADFIAGELTDEPIFYAYSNLDNHGKDVAFESELQQDWIVGASLWGLNFSIPIPLGALIPKGLHGLLVAGRSLAVDHDLAPCVRMKRDMQKCGEAAGITAALAVKHKLQLQQVPYAALKPLLEATGCLQEANHIGMRYGVPSKDDHIATSQWLTQDTEIREGLASDKPGMAIWSARNKGESIRSALKQWTAAEGEPHLQRHSAFALALLGDQAAIPLLREMVRERDVFFPKTSRKYNQARGYASIYLLGKLYDEGIVPQLLDILGSREQFANVSTDAEFINHDDEYFFQYFTFSLTALLRIAERCPVHRSAVTDKLEAVVEDPNFSLYVTLKPSKDVNYDMADTIRSIVRKQLQTWRSA